MKTNREKLDVALDAIADLASTLIPTLDVSDSLDQLEALLRLFEGASALEPDLFSKRQRALRAAEDAAREVRDEADEMLSEMAGVPLTPAQEDLLIDLERREEAVYEQGEAIDEAMEANDVAAEFEAWSDEFALPLWFETEEPPQAYRELADLGLIEIDDHGSPGEPHLIVELTPAGRRRAEDTTSVRNLTYLNERLPIDDPSPSGSVQH